jgi:hypothetical protein
MTPEGEVAAAGLTWFLETFISPAVDAAKRAAKRKRQEFDWGQAAEVYRQGVVAAYGTTRILGKPEPVTAGRYLYRCQHSGAPHGFGGVWAARIAQTRL